MLTLTVYHPLPTPGEPSLVTQAGGRPVTRQLVSSSDIAGAVGSQEVATRLKPYQLVGINYLLQLAAGQVGGAILADEMGLGKTAQTCVYLGEWRYGATGWDASTKACSVR